MSEPVAFTAVSKRFGNTRALENVSFTVGRGEAVALLGPNGAGKSTAVGLMLGLRRPDAGVVRIFGGDPRIARTRRMIGATPQSMAFPPRLSVDEVIDLVRAHFANAPPKERLIVDFELGSLRLRQTGGLSGGQQRRLAVALAFAGGTPAVFLDEPTTGMDVTARRALWSAAERYVQDGGTLVFSSHYFEEVEALADRVILIDRGCIRLIGTVDEIKSVAGLKRLRYRGPRVTLPGVIEAREHDGDVEVLLANADDAVRALVASGVEFHDLEVRGASLEEAFVNLTERARCAD
ncbi:MAG: ABC transporter ATP-binding protein [Pseudomonadota bacterium]